MPPFATAERTLLRASNAREGKLSRIVIGPDHGTPYALWIDDDAVSDPEAFNIPKSLAAALRAWQIAWSTKFLPQERWLDSVLEGQWIAEGQRLQAKIEELFWDSAIVERGF
ncbi:hypothetical protein [Rathayibacter iranicus]|uniref:hypothetical protein n=1 Tax=Rathayibacter iranicus TaxID=59737 RepID=UPI000FD9A315|nr:hypothetical protein [Rathayibacter iranicus]